MMSTDISHETHMSLRWLTVDSVYLVLDLGFGLGCHASAHVAADTMPHTRHVDTRVTWMLRWIAMWTATSIMPMMAREPKAPANGSSSSTVSGTTR